MKGPVTTLKRALKRWGTVNQAHSLVRARIQEHEASRAQQVFEREAASRGVAALTSEATVAALRRRLADRARNNGWPRRKGELHIFVAFSLFNWEQVLFEAFEPFGDVTVFEWTSQGFRHDAPEWPARRPLMNKAMLEAFEAAHARRPVDAVVGYLSGYNTLPETLARMAKAGAAIFNFSYDDTLGTRTLFPDGTLQSPLALAHVVDLNLTNNPKARISYAIHKGLSRFHPECADPKVHRPYEGHFRYDVSFIGACYGFRPQFIDILQRLGVRVVPFGPGWPNGELSLERMVQMYSETRINLGFSGVGHSRKLICLKGRDFEVPMSGGLYLTQHCSDLQIVFDIGREIVTYRDEADCAAQIRGLLADEERAVAIRRAGRARCLRDHTYEARWSRVFKEAGILEPTTKSQRSTMLIEVSTKSGTE